MAAEYNSLRYEESNGVATITLNRPERLNALDFPSVDELSRALDYAAGSEQARCVVITGAGRAFCAGADVKNWSDRINTGRSESRPIDRAPSDLFHFPKPVIASVNGVAVGMGLDIALAADLRVASTNARFGSAYIRVGIVPDFGGTFLLPRIVGLTKATELILTGRIIDAEEADQVGLLTELVSPDELSAATARWASLLAAGPTVAIGAAKENIRLGLSESFESSHLRERVATKLCMTTADHHEGVTAAAERRQPQFVGH
jgi:enoyl-CoA hydratase/carnithine racemase